MQPIAGPPFNDIHLWLNTEALSAADADAWQTFATQGLQAAGFAVVLHTNQPNPFGPHEAFAAACSSVALTRKLLHNIQHWVLAPAQAPGAVDAWLYSVLAACGLAQRLQLRASRRACTLVSSVFNADEYLSGFLLNASDLHGYEDTEHLLIRPGSTGSEHAALLRHAFTHDGAVYINLPSDPGLYNVWNLGCRLASGRYVSNANVDDRRAPDHLVHLQEQLKMWPAASVASTALRVSQQKNLAWADSSHCKVWFGELGNKLLDGADLFAQRNGQWVSRNVPHCMPLWRRSLHGWAGEFDQGRYGASADWAMWLKAASGGARFAVSPVAKGLYLRDESTFWRREHASGAVQRHEAHVLADFGWLAEANTHTEPQTVSMSSVTMRAMELLRMGAVLDALASLLCAWQERSPSELRLAHMAVAQLGRVYLGVQSLPSLLQAQAALYAADRDTGLWNALVDVAQACDAPQGHRAWRWLEWASMDWCETQGEGKGWVLLAWLASRQGQAEREEQLLRACHAAGPVAFWSDVQQAYRFGKPLAELSAIVGDATPQPLGQDAAHLHLKFFPDFRASNDYQTLLYAPWQAAGAQVAAASNWADFLQQSPSGTAGQVLHLHWLSLMFSRGLSPENLQPQARGLVANLSLRKAEGAEIHWTVHNTVSHASSAPELELEVQRDICLLANKVWVHHPMAAHLLNWMPQQANLALQEHGSYPLPDGAASNKAQAREAVGISQDAFLLTQTGMVKPYKGLHRWLPHLLAMLEEAPSMVLLLAGRISCDATLEFLHAHPHPRLVVMNRVLDKTTLHHCMVAADVGFLSYDRVLTSGTLAHWLGVGRPVLAPALGTLPAYVVPGWSGFLYDNAESMTHWLRYCINQPDALQRMTAHATKTGGTLRWGGPKTIHEIQGKPS
jgi:hypothetical protein